MEILESCVSSSGVNGVGPFCAVSIYSEVLRSLGRYGKLLYDKRYRSDGFSGKKACESYSFSHSGALATISWYVGYLQI